MKQQPQCYILSANQTGLCQNENEQRHKSLINALQTMGATKDVEGVWKGKREMSVVFVPWPECNHEDVQRVLRIYSQECAIFLGSDREAYILPASGPLDHIGPFQEVSKSRALEESSYTLDNGRYYVAKERIASAVGAYKSIERKRQSI